MIIPLGSGLVMFNFPLLFIFCCLSMGVYVLMVRGWSSNSNYALLGAIRGVAQTISYEVRLILLLMGVIFLLMGFRLPLISVNQEIMWFVVIFMPIFLCWMVTIVAE